MESYLKEERVMFLWANKHAKGRDDLVVETLERIDELQAKLARADDLGLITGQNYKEWEAEILPLPYYKSP